MTRIYCDICGEEMGGTDYPSWRVEKSFDGILWRLIVHAGHNLNSSDDLCIRCAKKIVGEQSTWTRT
jgi:hypothetical protein